MGLPDYREYQVTEKDRKLIPQIDSAFTDYEKAFDCINREVKNYNEPKRLTNMPNQGLSKMCIQSKTIRKT